MAKVFCLGVALALAVGLVPPAAGQEEPAKPEVTVDFRWIEPHLIKGVTEEKGHPITCGGEDWVAHLKPVLTSKHIATARLTHLHIAQVDQYAVEFTLTEEATEKLVVACGDAPGRWLTVYVNDYWYGCTYFDKAKPGDLTPPTAGYMLSKEHAEKIIEASKRPEKPEPDSTEPGAAADPPGE